MTENQKIEILVEIEKMLARDNISAHRIVQQTLSDLNNTQILEAAAEYKSAFMWASMWAPIMILALLFGIFISLFYIYHIGMNEVYPKYEKTINDLTLKAEKFEEKLNNNELILNHYISLFSSIESKFEKKMTKITMEYEDNHYELLDSVKGMYDYLKSSAREYLEINEALEKEIKENEFLRSNIKKQSKIINQKDKKINALGKKEDQK